MEKKERQRLRRIEEIETTVQTIEENISRNDELLCDPEVYQDHEKYKLSMQTMRSLIRSWNLFCPNGKNYPQKKIKKSSTSFRGAFIHRTSPNK